MGLHKGGHNDMGETWYFIDSGVKRPAYNMAFDEVLIDWHSRGLIPPILRFLWAGNQQDCLLVIFKKQ